MDKIITITAILFIVFSCQKNKRTLFERVDSGIDFQNKLIPTDELNAFTFTNFYNGGGVGIGDFNKDGKPDFVLTSNQELPGLYINKGNFQFEDVTAKSNLFNNGWITGVCVVDINQDGWDDIYLSKASHRNIKDSKNLLFINQKTPNPTFKEDAAAYGLDFTGFTTQTAFFDYDNDGDLDAFLLNTAPDESNPNWLRPAKNDGKSNSCDKLFENVGKNDTTGVYHYKDISIEAGILYEGLGLGLALSDFNNDGFTDIYCSNDFISSDILYLNQGDGTFRNIIKEATNHTSLYGMGVDAADLNNDGLTDIFQLDMLPDNNERQKQMIASSDYEKKKLSISSKYGYQLQYMRNTLQMNQGNANGKLMFSEIGLQKNIAMTDWSWSVLLSDYDLDGFKDIFISNGYRKNVTDLDFIAFNKNNNMFGTDESRATKQRELLNQVPEIKLTNYAFKSDSSFQFTNVSEDWGLNELSFANGVAQADLDDDGDLDLIVNNIDQEASIFRNTIKSKNSLTIEFQGITGNRAGIGAKVEAWINGKRQLFENYPVRGYLSSQEKTLIIGNDINSQVDSLFIKWPSGLCEVKYNITTDKIILQETEVITKKEEAKTNYNPLFESTDQKFLTFTHIASDFVDFNETPVLHKMLTRHGPAVASANLIGNKIPEIIVGGTYRGSPTQIFTVRNGVYQEIYRLTSTQFDVGEIILFDLENDGDKDVLLIAGPNERPLTAERAYEPILLKNSGNGEFEELTFSKTKVSSKAAVVFDYDKDGDEDIIIASSFYPGKYPTKLASVILENISGTLKLVENNSLLRELNQLELITDIKTCDFDSDGELDLVCVSEWGTLNIIKYDGDEFRLLNIENAPSGWWTTISFIDVDKDGDLDFMLGNEGLNTVFKASDQQPVKIYAKDFNADGSTDPLISYYLAGKEVPFSPLGTLTKQIVQFRKKYPLYASYAKANFNELFSKSMIENAAIKSVTELRSMIAFNEGNGKFRFEPLPPEAQESPIQDFLIHDFDKDGYQDVLITASFFPNESIMGRQDASKGTLLSGTPNGLKYIPNRYHGIWMNGDTRKTIFVEDLNRLFTFSNNGEVEEHQVVPRKKGVNQ